MKAAYREKMDAKMGEFLCFTRADSASDPIYTPPHWHTMTELLYIQEGVYAQQIGSLLFDAKPGNILLIGEEQVHATISKSRRRGAITVLQFYTDKSAVPALFSGRVAPEDAVWCELHNLVSALKKEYDAGVSAASYCRMKACLYQIQAIFLDQPPGSLYPAELRPDKEFIITASDYIAKNYGSPLSLQGAADHFHLSVPHFARLFKRHFGSPFMRYLNLYRLQVSNRILEETKSVSETAYLCGFPNPAAFIRQYKQYNHITPKQYLRLSGHQLEK